MPSIDMNSFNALEHSLLRHCSWEQRPALHNCVYRFFECLKNCLASVRLERLCKDAVASYSYKISR